MAELVPEGLIHERLGLRTLKPLAMPQSVSLRRLKMNGATYLHRRDVVKLLRAESEALGGDLVLDRLAKVIMEATR